MTKLSLDVISSAKPVRIRLRASVIDDQDTRYDGIVRILSIAELDPLPQASSINEALDRNSFGGFNLAYRVRKPEDMFGDWTQFRFEMNPLYPESRYPHWFCLPLDEFSRQLSLLRAMGMYPHEGRVLDDTWIKALILQMI